MWVHCGSTEFAKWGPPLLPNF